MSSYLYKPGHPLANENGFVEKSDYYYYKSLTEESKQMTNGNKPVTLNFISDEMPPTRHMASGKYFTSKKKFRNETRAHGCIEIGDQVHHLNKKRQNPPKLSKNQRREDIKRAVWELKNGRNLKKELGIRSH